MTLYLPLGKPNQQNIRHTSAVSLKALNVKSSRNRIEAKGEGEERLTGGKLISWLI